MTNKDCGGNGGPIDVHQHTEQVVGSSGTCHPIGVVVTGVFAPGEGGHEEVGKSFSDKKVEPETIRTLAKELIKVSTDLIYQDSHQFGSRPCQTCRTISTLIEIDFGCVRYAKEHPKRS